MSFGYIKIHELKLNDIGGEFYDKAHAQTFN